MLSCGGDMAVSFVWQSRSVKCDMAVTGSIKCCVAVTGSINSVLYGNHMEPYVV